MLFLFFSLFYSTVHAGAGDPPEYSKNIDHLMDLSRKQTDTFITGVWHLPGEVSSNPGMADWNYDDSINSSYPNIIMSWCSGTYACPYFVLQTGDSEPDWQIKKKVDAFESFKKHGGTGRHPLLVGDIRLYYFKKHLHMTYVAGSPLMYQSYAPVYFDKGLNALYLLEPPSHMVIDHEMGKHHQKNWSPFVYHFRTDYPFPNQKDKYNVNNDNYLNKEGYEKSANFFIYSVNPHRIVHGNETAANGITKVHTVTATEIIEEPIRDPNTNVVKNTEFWHYGQPRGGTPALLVDTKYGPRYLTFFHSQGKFSINYILTYYMGAYLFNPEPPFEITHVSPDPIIPNQLYNESFGWAFKAIDYIVFPTGLIIRGKNVFVSCGRNDNSGWIVKFDKDLLVDSMKAVKSRVLTNRFHEHFSHFSLD